MFGILLNTLQYTCYISRDRVQIDIISTVTTGNKKWCSFVICDVMDSYFYSAWLIIIRRFNGRHSKNLLKYLKTLVVYVTM